MVNIDKIKNDINPLVWIHINGLNQVQLEKMRLDLLHEIEVNKFLRLDTSKLEKELTLINIRLEK